MIAFLMKTEDKWKVVRFRRAMREFGSGLWGFTWSDLAQDPDLLTQVANCGGCFTYHASIDAAVWVPPENRQSSVAS